MIIVNKKRGIERLECTQDDIFMDLEKVSIKANCNGSTILLGEYPNGDYMIDAYKHLLMAFKLEEEYGLEEFLYEITC